MSLVALKNAISSIISKKSSSPLLTSDNIASTQYGASNDLESNTLRSSTSNKHNNDSNSIKSLAIPITSTSSSSFFNNLFTKIDPRIISDLIIGLSDGLTVPFALTAGLSSLGDSKLVITGGFAELISGAISMGLGGYLGAKSELDYYKSEVKLERRKFYQDTNLVNHDIEDILLSINPNFTDETILSFIKDLQNEPELMLDFIIKYGRGLDEPAENRQIISATTIGGGYLAGGLVPLLPYFFVSGVGTGLLCPIIVMAITLFLFGYIKAQLSMGDTCNTYKPTN